MSHRSIFHTFDQEQARRAKAERALQTGIILNDKHYEAPYSISEALRGKVLPVSEARCGLAYVPTRALLEMGADAFGRDYVFPVEDFDLADNPFAFWNRLKSSREVGVMP